MRQARATQFDPSEPPWLHCISRCVRRAFLCGDGFEHRKDWLERRLRVLAQTFSVEVGAYAIMSNHLHVVVLPNPQAVQALSDETVVTRWWLMKHDVDGDDPDQAAIRPGEATVERLIADQAFVTRWRGRLGDIGWFMKSLKEPLSRMANKEDNCTGAFWEGRFTSVPLLDPQAVVACMAYVDLNPIRAQLAATPEESAHTSVKTRIDERQQAQAQAHAPAQTASTPTERGQSSWLTPVSTMTSGLGGLGLRLDEYLQLVDHTGRMIRGDKRGAIAADLSLILDRLAMPIEVDDWLSTVGKPKGLRGAVLGLLASVNGEVRRRSGQWLQVLTPLFKNPATFVT